jgi:topoisomerase-4 subunit A
LILKHGFFGTKVSGPIKLECTNFDKVVLFYKDGTYQVVNIPEKQYAENVAWVGVADKKTVMNVIYKNKETGQAWAKRFIVDKFILEKSYHYIDPSVSELQFISDKILSLPSSCSLFLKPTKRSKNSFIPLKDVLVKGAQARGIRLDVQQVKKVVLSKS